MRQLSETTVDFDILNGLLQLYRTIPQTYNKNAIALIVDAMLDFTPELQDWNTYIKKIMSSKVTVSDKSNLLEFFCQAMIQSMTGTCEVLRTKPRQTKIRKSINTDIILTFITHYQPLTQIFSKNKCSILSLFKVLNTMDLSQLEENNETKLVPTSFQLQFSHFFIIYFFFRKLSKFTIVS